MRGSSGVPGAGPRAARRRGSASPRLAWQPDAAELYDAEVVGANARGILTRRQRSALQDQLAGDGAAGCFTFLLMLVPLGALVAHRPALGRLFANVGRGPFVGLQLARWELRVPWLHLLIAGFALMWLVLLLRGLAWSTRSWRTALALRRPGIGEGRGTVAWGGRHYVVTLGDPATPLRPWNGALI